MVIRYSKAPLCDGHDFDGSSLDLKIKRVPSLKIELLPDFRGDGDLPFAGERGLHSLHRVRISVLMSILEQVDVENREHRSNGRDPAGAGLLESSAPMAL